VRTCECAKNQNANPGEIVVTSHGAFLFDQIDPVFSINVS